MCNTTIKSNDCRLFTINQNVESYVNISRTKDVEEKRNRRSDMYLLGF